MITTWSWFGTNQLGIGLHAYGFKKDLIDLCKQVWISHLALLVLGSLPMKYWRSDPSGKQGLVASKPPRK
jgi:hypothetical protein